MGGSLFISDYANYKGMPIMLSSSMTPFLSGIVSLLCILYIVLLSVPVYLYNIRISTRIPYTVQDMLPPIAWYCLVLFNTTPYSETTSVPRYSAPSSTFRSRSLQLPGCSPRSGGR